MSRLKTIAVVIALVLIDAFAFGSLGGSLGLLYLRIVSDSAAAGWLVYVVALVLALSTVGVARVVSRSERPLSIVVRVALFSFPTFFCGQLATAGVLDWSPFALASGMAVCLGAGLAAFLVSGKAVTQQAIDPLS